MFRIPHAHRLVLLALSLALAPAIAPAPAGAAAPASANAVPSPAFRLAALPPSFTAPVWAGAAPGDASGTVYVVEQVGRVWKVRGGSKTSFLDLRRIVKNSGEQGLLAMAFAADYRTS